MPKTYRFAWLLVLWAANAADPVRAAAVPKAEKAAVELRGHGGRGIAFSGNGARAVTWDDHSAQVWVVATGQPLGPAVTQGRELTAASLDAEGERLLTKASVSATVWDVATGKSLQSFWHGAEVASATFDSKGGRVLTAGGGNVRVWDAKTGERVWIAQHAKHLHSAAFAANDARVLGFVYEGDGANAGDGGKAWAVSAQALVWDAGSGWLLEDYDVDLWPDEFSPDVPVHPAAISPDGTRVARRVRLSLEIWTSAGRHRIERHTCCNDQWAHKYPIIGGSPTWFAYRPDGKALLTMGVSATAILWDADLNEPTVLEALGEDPWESATFVAGGTRLMVSGRRAGVVVMDLSSEQVLFRSPKPSKEDAKTTRAAVSADGRYVAMTSQSGGVTFVWEVPPAAKK
jgi:WD40 repeat protein